MKIAMLNANDIDGGAAVAAYRLNEGLNKNGITSRMFVQKKNSSDYRVITEKNKYKNQAKLLLNKIDKIPNILYKGKPKDWHSCIVPSNKKKMISEFDPDVIHLHWTCEGFLSIEEIGDMDKPIIWTMHDMWPFTGGCNYASGCENFLNGCGSCPQLKSKKINDLSSKNVKRKEKNWSAQKITLVAPSQWLANEAKKSKLFSGFDIRVIPNGIDTSVFKPLDKKEARNILNLDENKKIVLFGAVDATSDKRKGFSLLKESLDYLRDSGHNDNIELLVFGSSRPENEIISDYKITYLGSLKDQISLVLAYSAADLFVAPSIEDNLPNTVIESMSCGTPVLAYNIGGMGDMIDNSENGYLIPPFDTKIYAEKIKYLLNEPKTLLEFSIKAREKVLKNFDLKYISDCYLELYNEKL
ncbi:glycosyltransferase family 4 protein [Exiguobacterium sp. s102]|uniref:glycosyltransferase family 4 protein n=1 Tax=Exiguobacterium sp. s102 TaxID=2751212 RepID=UPI001BEC7B80|nr:glycosyltransferase family 4 protein [Exiguobacterium sp. s102]